MNDFNLPNDCRSIGRHEEFAQVVDNELVAA